MRQHGQSQPSTPEALAVAAAATPTRAASPDAALIEYLQAPATDLNVFDGTSDVVLCQQRLPFFIDRPGAAAQLRCVLRTDDRSAWLSGAQAPSGAV